MPATISLTLPAYHSGVARSDSREWISILRNEVFQKIAEAVSVIGLFVVMGLWLLILPTL